MLAFIVLALRLQLKQTHVVQPDVVCAYLSVTIIVSTKEQHTVYDRHDLDHLHIMGPWCKGSADTHSQFGYFVFVSSSERVTLILSTTDNLNILHILSPWC